MGNKVFVTKPMPRICFGHGTVKQASVFAEAMRARHVLLVTDPGVSKAGHPARLAEDLRALGCEVTIFANVVENPTTATVDDCAKSVEGRRPGLIIGLGGGSSLDTAKGANFVITNGGNMKDYCGYGRAEKPFVPMLAIPTTTGTGSECQSYALISDSRSHEKMACGDPKALPAMAILDPALTLSQPQTVAACTGVDAMCHAIESAVSTARNSYSLHWSREALRLIFEFFPILLYDAVDLHSRGQMMLAAAYAGIAIENSMLGAAHGAANPLTAKYGITHGHAVGIMLPHVIRFNADDDATRAEYAMLARYCELVSGDDSDAAGCAKLLVAIDTLLNQTGLQMSLDENQVDRDDLISLASMAEEQFTTRHNPRPISAEQFFGMYTEAFEAAAPEFDEIPEELED